MQWCDIMAFVSGLKQYELQTILKVRKLPIQGEVLVKKGETVTAHTPIARAFVPGNRQIINLGYHLGRTGIDVKLFMYKNQGDYIEAGELIASRKYLKYILFGKREKQFYAPKHGLIEYIFGDGRLVISEPISVELDAYIPGKVKNILENEGAIIETTGGYIQGIFGIGGETYGNLHILTESRDDIITSGSIMPDMAGKIIVGGALVQKEALQKAVEVGVNGIVIGGICDKNLTKFLGYELGVGITGREEIDLTIIITEGFGEIPMEEKTFNILKKYEGTPVSINGTTQIRAGVIRPELIIPKPDSSLLEGSKATEDNQIRNKELKQGTNFKIIREPHFGELGQIINLPIERQKIDTESKVRVLEAELINGKRIVIPRANIELK